MSSATDEALHPYPHPIPWIYKYIGARTTPLSESAGHGSLAIRPDLRYPNGPSAAALAVFLQDLSAVTIARFAPLVVPIQISVRIREGAADADELFAHSEILRNGRAVQFTEARIVDVKDPSRIVAYATGSWATMGSNLPEPSPRKPGPGTPTAADPAPSEQYDSILDAIGAVRRADGRGYELAGVDPAHTEPVALGGTATGTLHAGAMQVLAEGAAWLAASQVGPSEGLRIEELTTQFLAPARITPIAALGEPMAVNGDALDTRVEVREDGGEGRMVALSLARFKILPS